MANDILNTGGTTTDSASVGAITVATGGRGSLALVRQSRADARPPCVESVLLTTLSDKYDDRFDDPRYYQGDAST